jgi:hypothetical protein
MLNKCYHDEFVPDLDIVPTWLGQMRVCYFGGLGLPMPCIVRFSFVMMPKWGVVDLIEWITNGVISIVSSDQNRFDRFQREQRRFYPGAMCIVFLQCVLKFLFKVWEWLVLLANFGYAVACWTNFCIANGYGADMNAWTMRLLCFCQLVLSCTHKLSSAILELSFYRTELSCMIHAVSPSAMWQWCHKIYRPHT